MQTFDSAQEIQPAATDAADGPGYTVGYGRPPTGRPFAPGISGNPMGRPRRPVMIAGLPRRLIPAQPTELERALALPVICPAADPEPVSLARALVARLTERALAYGDVAACRELLRLSVEAESVQDERLLLAAEQADAEAGAAAKAETERAEREHRLREGAQAEARALLDRLAEDAARDAGDQDLDGAARALKLLDAAEVDDRGAVTTLKPWVVKAAAAHSPRLPRSVDARPLDLAAPADALDRLEIVVEDEDGDPGLAAWFLDAARARRPKRRFAPGDEALLARVRVEEVDADWVDRLAAVEAMMTGSGGETTA